MKLETNLTDCQLDLNFQVAWVSYRPMDKAPIESNTRSLAVALAGRLDNRKALARQLDLPGLDAGDDRALIAAAYGRWGRALPEYLDGDFCFLVWDPSEQRLIGARDPLGGKSFFYFIRNGAFFGTNRLATLLAHPAVPVQLNHAQLALSTIPLADRVFNDQATLYKGVYSLPGGTAFCFDANGFKSWTYWQPNPHARLSVSDTEVPEALRELLFAAVENRLPAAGEAGALLSGGLDSSAIVAVAANILKKKNRSLTTFSAVVAESLRGHIEDEREFIRHFSHHGNIHFVDVTDEGRGPFDNVAALTQASRVPFHSSRHYLYSAFVDAAGRHNVETLLDGCFGEMGSSCYGDGYFSELAMNGNWSKLARAMNDFAKVRQISLWQVGKSHLLRPLLPMWVMSMIGRGGRFEVQQSAQHSPLHASFIKRHLNGNALEILGQINQHFLPTSNHRVNQARHIRFAQSRHADGTVFDAADRPFSFQYPLLDKHVIEFCLAAPGHLKIQNGYSRSLIRTALEGLLPPAIQWRTSKTPFSPDFHIRYNRQRPQTVAWLRMIAKNDPIRDVVDVDRLTAMAESSMQGNRGDTTNDFIAMHMVPKGVYLIEFLRHFPEFSA